MASRRGPGTVLGYGLTYKDDEHLENLSTEEHFTKVKRGMEAPLFVGKAQDPWQVYAVAPSTTNVRYLSGIAKNGPVAPLSCNWRIYV